MSPRASPWAALPDPAQRRLLEAIRAALEARAPGAVRAATAPGKAWGTLTVTGTGTRRLPGMRRDLRTHELRAATDGQWLQLTYRVDGFLVDSATRTDAAVHGPAAAAAFFQAHLPKVWWKAPPAKEAEGAPAKKGKADGGERGDAGPPSRAGGRGRGKRDGAAPRGRKRHRKP